MKFHYAGKYDGDESKLPQREHPENSVPFKEPDMKKFAVIINILGTAIIIILAIPFYAVSRDSFSADTWWDCLGVLAGLAALIPHEFVHALGFKSDVYLYTDLKKGILFVVGTEDMSKARFIIMSIMPSIIFGFVPFAMWYFNHDLIVLGIMGIFGIGSAAGDYVNIINALSQMPNGAKTYLSGTHSYWYIKNN